MNLLLIYFIIYLTSSISVHSEIVNVSVNRKIDLNLQIVKIKTQVIFRKTGEQCSKYTYLIDTGVDFFSINITNKDGFVIFHERNGNKIDVLYNKPFVDNENEILNVEEVHLHQIKPTFGKQHFAKQEAVWYQGNSHCYSLYKTLECTVIYLFKGDFQASISPALRSLEFAQYYSKLVPPLTREIVRFDFFMKDPLLAAINLLRMIDVSHFGYIMVRDEVHLKNIGADLYGPYKPSPNNWIYTHLPASAENVAMYDEIGLRYNYMIHEYSTHKTLQFKTRYPLLGGWQTRYTLAYTVPTHEYLVHTNLSTFQLTMRTFDHILNDIVIHSFTTNVILPENSHNYQFQIPHPYETEVKLSRTQLSCFGRPTIVIHGGNVMEDNENIFIIKYDFDQAYLLRIPLKLVLFYFIVLVLIITSIRLPRYISLTSGPCCK